MISKKDFKLLSSMLKMRNHGFLEINRPKNVDGWRLDRLVEMGLIRKLTIVPKDQEPFMPDGLIMYQVSDQGEDNTEQYKVDAKRNAKQRAKDACSHLGCLAQLVISLLALAVAAYEAVMK